MAQGYSPAEAELHREWRENLTYTLRDLAASLAATTTKADTALVDLKLCRATFENIHKDVEHDVAQLSKELKSIKAQVSQIHTDLSDHIKWCNATQRGSAKDILKALPWYAWAGTFFLIGFVLVIFSVAFRILTPEQGKLLLDALPTGGG